MCDHKHNKERQARVCECGAFIPAAPPAERAAPKPQRLAKGTGAFVGVPRRPVHRMPDETDSRLYPLGIFDYTRMDAFRPSYEDDFGGSFDDCRRLREDGYPRNYNFNTLNTLG